MVEAALDGLDGELLTRRAAEDSNPMARIFWHMNRVVNIFINTRLRQKSELWIRDGWRLKFGMDEQARITGWTAQRVTAWAPPEQETQMGYFAAVKSEAREYITTLTTGDLGSTVTFPPEAQTQDHTIATALGQLAWDNVAHGGQIAYLRGLHKGMGWHR